MSWSSPKKKVCIFFNVNFMRRKFLWHLCFVSMYSVLNKLSEHIYFILLHIKKHYFIHFCCLFLKSSKAFSISLNFTGLLLPRFLIVKNAWKFLLGQMFFFQFIVTFCIRISLINLPKQLFIIKAWSFTRNRTCHSLRSLKQAPWETPPQNLSLPFIAKAQNCTKIRLRQSMKLKTDSICILHCHL